MYAVHCPNLLVQNNTPYKARLSGVSPTNISTLINATAFYAMSYSYYILL